MQKKKKINNNSNKEHTHGMWIVKHRLAANWTKQNEET